jgi:hypothetical protein
MLDNNPAVNDGANYLHAIGLADGTERPGSPVRVQGADPSHPSIVFDARCQRNRPGLLLMNGVVYLGFGTFNCDQPCPGGVPYHGWVFGYRASDLALLGVFCTTPDGGGGGVWQSGGGLVGSEDGSVYFETGNDTAPAALGDAFVRLHAVGTPSGLALGGSFQPSNAAVLRGGDTDLGSGGPILLAGRRLIGGGKQGRYYVLDADTMMLTQDTTSSDPSHIGQGFQAFVNTYHPEYPEAHYADGEAFGPNIHSAPLYWEGTGFIYQMAEKDFLKAFRYDPAARTVEQHPALTGSVRPPNGMPGGFSSISANGDRDGIIWTSLPNADGQWTKVPGTLVAFDATTLAELWRDPVPESFAKFCPPTVADGKVIRATFASDVHHGVAGKIIVYGQH